MDIKKSFRIEALQRIPRQQSLLASDGHKTVVVCLKMCAEYLQSEQFI